MAAEGGRRRAAKVDATAEKELAQRFEVTGFPTLLLLSHRRAYTYDSAKRLARGTAVTERGGCRQPNCRCDAGVCKDSATTNKVETNTRTRQSLVCVTHYAL